VGTLAARLPLQIQNKNAQPDFVAGIGDAGGRSTRRSRIIDPAKAETKAPCRFFQQGASN